MRNLRDLRLWHWRKAMEHRNCAQMASDRNPGFIASENKRADHHIGAVQILNDYVDGTAEHDDQMDHSLTLVEHV